MPAPHEAQMASPGRSVGPVTIRGGGHLRIVTGKACGDLFQQLKDDDWGDLNIHDGGRVVQAAGSGVSAPIGPFAGRVITASENTVERTDAESCPPTCPITVLVEPFGGFLHPERTRAAIPLRIDSKDQADELRFDRINFEALLDLGATALGLDDAIAEGRSRTVPKALLGRFAHRTDDVLAVLARCIFVEDANDLPHQLLRRIIAGRLGDGDYLDAVLAQLADGELHLRTIAIEAREGMDADDVEATVGAD